MAKSQWNSAVEVRSLRNNVHCLRRPHTPETARKIMKYFIWKPTNTHTHTHLRLKRSCRVSCTCPGTGHGRAAVKWACPRGRVVVDMKICRSCVFRVLCVCRPRSTRLGLIKKMRQKDASSPAGSLPLLPGGLCKSSMWSRVRLGKCVFCVGF